MKCEPQCWCSPWRSSKMAFFGSWNDFNNFTRNFNKIAVQLDHQTKQAQTNFPLLFPNRFHLLFRKKKLKKLFGFLVETPPEKGENVCFGIRFTAAGVGQNDERRSVGTGGNESMTTGPRETTTDWEAKRQWITNSRRPTCNQGHNHPTPSHRWQVGGRVDYVVHFQVNIQSSPFGCYLKKKP